MGIFDTIFGSAQPAPVQPATIPQVPGQPTPPGNILPPEVPPIDGSGVIPTPPVAPVAEPKKDDHPLDQFSKLWETEPKKDGEGDDAPNTALSAEEIQKVVAKVDFTKSITPENLAAITAGGEGAVAAMVTALNTVGQQALTQSTLINNRLAEQMIAKAIESSNSKIPDIIRSQSASNHLNDTNPLFSNPAVKPVMDAARVAFLGKHPNATPAEITEMTEDYMTAMLESLAPAKPTENTPNKETDWNKFLTGN